MSDSRNKSVASEKELRIVRKTAWVKIASNSWRAFTLILLFSIALYALVASTMTRFAPTNLGVAMMTTPKFEGGIAKPGEIVYVAPAKNFNYGVLENLKSTVVPTNGVFKVELLEGPVGPVEWADYGIEPDDPKMNLNSQYIARCIEGCKVKDRNLLIHSSNIMGVPAKVK